MVAYKGFNNKLQARLGKGVFSYKIGKTYREGEVQCANTGFHCVEQPIETLSWYNREDDRYCIVKAEGDIHEDGKDKISCTKLTIVKEINKLGLMILQCDWMAEHPDREYSKQVKRDTGVSSGEPIIVRGKNPVGKGPEGAYLFLVQEYKNSNKIKKMNVIQIDGKYKADQYYDVLGREVKG